MFNEFPYWAQLLLPAFIILCQIGLHGRLKMFPEIKADDRTLTEASAVAYVAMYLGFLCATPIGFPYFLWVVNTLEKVWFYVFWICTLCMISLVAYYESKGIDPTQRATPKTCKTIYHLFFVAIFFGYIKLSKVIWVQSVNDPIGVLHGDDFFYRYSLGFTVLLWVCIGVTMLAMAMFEPGSADAKKVPGKDHAAG